MSYVCLIARLTAIAAIGPINVARSRSISRNRSGCNGFTTGEAGGWRLAGTPPVSAMAFANSAAVPYRRAGSKATYLSMTRFNASGTAGFRIFMSSGPLFSINDMISVMLFPRNGFTPVSNSKKMTPAANRSVR